MSWIEGTGNVFDELVEIEEDIVSTKVAKPTAVDGMAEFPFWINYPVSGEFDIQSSNWGYGLHTIRCELHVMRGALADNEKEIRPYLQPFYKELCKDPTLSGTVEGVNAIRYKFTGWDYQSGEKHIGIEFEVDVKVDETFTP